VTASVPARPRDGHRSRLFAVLVALLVAMTVLAACGDSDDDGGDTGSEGATTTAAAEEGGATTTAAEEGGASTTAAAEEGGASTSAAEEGGEATGDAGSRLVEILGIGADEDLGGDVAFDMGAVLALTGPGSFYGTTMSRGIDLAVKHIEAAGGPDFNVMYYDHKSGDAQAGVDAITELGTQGVPAKLASYVDDLGAMLPGTAQYEVFTLDGGGGTSEFGKSQPFFWGTRAITPNDTLNGMFQWVKATYPDAQTVGLVGWDVGEPSNGIIREDVLAQVAAAGLEFNGLYELVPIGNLDYSAVFPKILDNEPDILLMGLYGQDPGAFILQSKTAGLEAEIIGFEFTPDGIDASRGAYEEGYTFTYDYFNPDTPTNPLAAFFVEEFRAEYGEDPDFYAANFYENTIAMWEVIRRVLAKGGDPNSGAELDAALQENLSLPSVYGGDESSPGVYTLDPETHSVIQRPMGVFRYQDGEVTPLAFFDIGGENFEIVGE
jgi:ABC-type branched-subunit amino acid transport system substrate-binding protein